MRACTVSAMPFNREYDDEIGAYTVNRGRTSQPPPPETGKVVAEDGTIVARTQLTYPSVPPATPVTVTFPGPNEPLVLRDGRISPRWWRFLDELWRRTGGVIDNINRIPTIGLKTGAPDDLLLSGYAPTIVVTTNVKEFPSTGSLGLTGYAPTVTVA